MNPKPSLSRALTTFESGLRGQKRAPTDRVPEPETKRRKIQPLARATTVPIKQTENRLQTQSTKPAPLCSKPVKTTLKGADKSTSVLVRNNVNKNKQEIQGRFLIEFSISFPSSQRRPYWRAHCLRCECSQFISCSWCWCRWCNPKSRRKKNWARKWRMGSSPWQCANRASGLDWRYQFEIREKY